MWPGVPAGAQGGGKRACSLLSERAWGGGGLADGASGALIPLLPVGSTPTSQEKHPPSRPVSSTSLCPSVRGGSWGRRPAAQPGSRDHPHRSLRPHTPASETLPADVRGLGAGGAHLAEADESGGRKSGPLGFVEGAVARNLVLEPMGSTPYRVTTLPFRASLYLLETGVFMVLKAVCCDNLTLNRWRKGIN